MIVLDYFLVIAFSALFLLGLVAAISQTVKCWLGWCAFDSDELVWDYERDGMMCPHCDYFEC